MVSPWPTLYKLSLGKKHQIQECAKFTEDHCLWHLVCDSVIAWHSLWYHAMGVTVWYCPYVAKQQCGIVCGAMSLLWPCGAWFHIPPLFQLLGATNLESAQSVKLVMYRYHHQQQQQYDHVAY